MSPNSVCYFEPRFVFWSQFVDDSMAQRATNKLSIQDTLDQTGQENSQLAIPHVGLAIRNPSKTKSTVTCEPVMHMCWFVLPRMCIYSTCISAAHNWAWPQGLTKLIARFAIGWRSPVSRLRLSVALQLGLVRTPPKATQRSLAPYHKGIRMQWLNKDGDLGQIICVTGNLINNLCGKLLCLQTPTA